MADKNVYEVTDLNFESEVLKSSVPVLVDFWATWCGPCLALAPAVAAIAQEQEGRVKVCKVNVDDNPKTAANFGIKSIPTLILIKDGQNLGQLVGNVPQGAIKELLKKIG